MLVEVVVLLEIAHLKEVEQVDLEVEVMVNIHQLHQVEVELELQTQVVEVEQDIISTVELVDQV